MNSGVHNGKGKIECFYSIRQTGFLVPSSFPKILKLGAAVLLQLKQAQDLEAPKAPPVAYIQQQGREIQLNSGLQEMTDQEKPQRINKLTI